MKIAFGMIIFNGDFVLKQCLESVYPYANQILIAEGPVTYWQSQGYSISTDDTNSILDNFPDPENKIKVVHGQFSEKDEQCNAYMKYLEDNNDYIWNLDCDEIFKQKDIEKIIELLETEKYTSVGFKSCTFYGGFEKKLTGFEENAQFLRIYKIYPGSRWLKHRPPVIKHIIDNPLPEKHLDFNTLASVYGIKMYHYSYVFPRQVYEKVNYYKAAVSKEGCIDNYFNEVYLPWVLGNDEDKKRIEDRYQGVHEFKPHVRGECRTEIFKDQHPDIILRDMDSLKNKFYTQLHEYKISKAVNIDESTCWYKEECHKPMINGVEGLLWPKLEDSTHFPVLNNFLIHIADKNKKLKILDVGCGGAALQDIKIIRDSFNYTGVDLPEVIENVAKKLYPDSNYIKIDLVRAEDLNFIGGYDVVVMNGLIDVMQYPIQMLDKILRSCKKYVAIHRQEITYYKTHIIRNKAYNGETFQSIFNLGEFLSIIENNNFRILKLENTKLTATNYSVLLEKFEHMRTRNLCTLSDYNYLTKGLVLYESLLKNSEGNFILYYLCIDKKTYTKLQELKFKNLVPIFAGDIIELTNIHNMPYDQYCWSLASRFCLYLINIKAIEDILYIDSDIVFYHNFEKVYNEIGDRSIGIIPHLHNKVGDYVGGYNVGLIYFKQNKIGKKCLEFWVDCVINPNNAFRETHGTCGDQKYLELFEILFPINEICIIQDNIGHGAPWNFHLYNYDMFSFETKMIIFKEKLLPLTFIHFSHFKPDYYNNKYSPSEGTYFSDEFIKIPEIKQIYDEYFLLNKNISEKYKI